MTLAEIGMSPSIDIQSSLKDLQKLVSTLEDDLRTRSDELTDVKERLTREYNQARSTERTLDTYESWRDEYLTQVAVAWVLSGVFLRYLEDNLLIDEVWLAGEGERLTKAHDRHQLYFQRNPTHTDREYFQEAFRSVAALPGCRELFGEDRNPLWLLGPSGDAAKELLAFWQAIDPASGQLVRTFGDPESGKTASTRFLGDLYQDLSEAARKRYALLQTPDFVEEFILDRTLDPAIETFGLEEVRMLDPTCGSGHFLLGGFSRLLKRWRETAPGVNERELTQRALDGVYGVDLNPFAVAIARFRLMVAALRACGMRRLKDAPAFAIHVAAGDSLLHGRRFYRDGQGALSVDRDWLPDSYAQGDFEEATEILSRQYHAVVGNPPYIVDKDKAHNSAVRERYSSCHRQFSLAVPFKELFFDKAVSGPPAGYLGMITANSFMKREFGKKLIEEFFPTVDLTHVIDTSGAYIPGHGTPTVILFGRDQTPRREVVRAALGIRGEPTTPEDASQGKVWTSIVDNLDRPGAENEFVTIADVEREKLYQHPWSLSGGGAAELKDVIESAKSQVLGEVAQEVGFGAVTREDDVYLVGAETGQRQRIDPRFLRPLVAGESVRDWAIVQPVTALWPYDAQTFSVERSPELERFLWPWKRQLSSRVAYGKSQLERGLEWFEYSMFFTNRFRTPLTITFAFVATHNHFVLDRGGKVFNRSAPVIKLPEGATEEEHLALLGLLNSSVACFWLKQVSHDKGSGTDKGKWQADPAKIAYEFTGTAMQAFPIPAIDEDSRRALIDFARHLDRLARERAEALPSALPDVDTEGGGSIDQLRARIAEARLREVTILHVQVALQEELDWFVYGLYGLAQDFRPLDPEVIAATSGCPIGARPFELVQARRGRRHGVDRHPLYPEIPPEVGDEIRAAWEVRARTLQSHPPLALIEDENYKRRWFVTPKHLAGGIEAFEDRLEPCLRNWLLDRLETTRYRSGGLITTARLADIARSDSLFLQVAELYTGRDDFDLTRLVTDLVMAQDVPYLSALRYKPSGLRKRAQWERTWELQRKEDAGEKVGKIPVPPKYGSGDFQKSHYWSLRGKLDVPKERFISYPLAERDADPTPVIGWAGWNHLQQAQALASYYLERKDQDGWEAERLTPLLAGLLELIPWLKQWHNDIDPEMQVRLGDFYEGFLNEQARSLGLALQDLRAWKPPAKAARKRRKKT